MDSTINDDNIDPPRDNSKRESEASKLTISNRSDFSDLSDFDSISPAMIYEQRQKLHEKLQRESDEGMERQHLQPVKKDSLQPPPTQEEAAHNASVQDYINQQLQARAVAVNINLEEQQQEQPNSKREVSITFPSSLDELQHPPNLPMREDSGLISSPSSLFDMSDRSANLPAIIQEQRDKAQAKSHNDNSGSPSHPGAVRIGSDDDMAEDGASNKARKFGSLASVSEHLAVEAKLVNDDENSDFFKAKLEEEAEVYRNQLREEQEKQKSEIVYATATKEDPLGNCASFLLRHKWKLLGFLFILAGGFAALVLIALAPEPTPTAAELPLVYDPPTAEECAAISRGESLPGQEDMIVELLDVEVDVSLDSGSVDIATLLPSLEAAMKEHLVPALSDCPFEESTRKLRGGRELGSENPKYAIANTFLQLQDRPGVSCSAASVQPCHRIVMKLELFLKGPEYVSTLMNMVYDVGLKRPVVVTLGLGAPYTVIDFVAINSGTPSAPTLAPTELPLVYDPPTPQDCDDISNALYLVGQEDLIVELLDVEVDVSLDSEAVDIMSLLPSLEAVMKKRLVPALSHCPFEENRRQLVSENAKYAVANTFLQLQDRPGVSCSAASVQPCHRIVMKLELFLKGPEYVSTLMNLVYDLRKDRPVVETLGLGSSSPYRAIDFVAINSGTPSSDSSVSASSNNGAV